ncbi:MAG TPA: hypothetical protein VH721_03440 [Gaiellaceae bacterium]|jgi:hypothetical protein
MNVVQRSLAVALAATGTLAGASPAAAAIDPSASAVLASALKPAMQQKLKSTVPGLVVTKVTCFVPRTSKAVSGKCTAKFKITKYRLTGVYQARATLDGQSRLSWSTSSVSCSDAKTHKPVKC